MIAVDWGTSNFRAFLLDEGGAIRERRASAQGLMRVEGGGFAETLRAEVGDWMEAGGEQTVVLCGMVGSRHGWVETPYLPCPVTPRELAAGMVEVPFTGARVLIVPGVEGTGAAGVPEVMRGEETASVGCMGDMKGEGLICLPGTHSKWVQVDGGAIQSFTTSMTGEVYAAVREHTILAQLMSPDTTVDREAFAMGVERSGEGGGLLQQLFSVRTLRLKGVLAEAGASSYLSGLLIGHEVRSSMPAGSTVRLAGAKKLCELYALAIAACGGEPRMETADAAARGLAMLAALAGEGR